MQILDTTGDAQDEQEPGRALKNVLTSRMHSGKIYELPDGQSQPRGELQSLLNNFERKELTSKAHSGILNVRWDAEVNWTES